MCSDEFILSSKYYYKENPPIIYVMADMLITNFNPVECRSICRWIGISKLAPIPALATIFLKVVPARK